MSWSAGIGLKPRLAGIALALGAVFAVVGCIWGPESQRPSTAFLSFVLAWTAMIDIDRFLLPNVLTLGLVVCGLVIAALQGPAPFIACAIAAALGYGVLAGAALLYRLLRKREGLGLGDAKLLAAAGAWLGWMALPSVLLAASGAAMSVVIAMAIVRRKFDRLAPVAFGPFIAAGFWLVWTFDPLGLARIQP
jgi:leader peptidase (prepilin peptidase)/N-methyltransferase